ncbi:hypothetical protein [Microcoleus sp. AT13-A5]|uniref:hypothetical protein n=1 Tax=Microcoleus sp. AT13-A5 TaxID=2818590 RepID=UPI002FD0F391
MYKFIAILIFISSIVALIATGNLVASVLAIYPPSHIGSFGPVIPGVAKAYASWLPAAPMWAYGIASASALVGLGIWRFRRPASGKLEVALVVGALNFFLSLFLTTMLVVAYFYLPKVANAA